MPYEFDHSTDDGEWKPFPRRFIDLDEAYGIAKEFTYTYMHTATTSIAIRFRKVS